MAATSAQYWNKRGHAPWVLGEKEFGYAKGRWKTLRIHASREKGCEESKKTTCYQEEEIFSRLLNNS